MTRGAVLLHAGFPKTATSTLQMACLAAREPLSAAGLLLPDDKARDRVRFQPAFRGGEDGEDGRHEPGLARRRAEAAAFVERVSRLAAEEPGRAILLSKEGVSLARPETLRGLAEWARGLGRPLRVIVWVREPVAYAASLMQQGLKAGGVLEDELARPRLHCFRTGIERLGAAFGPDTLTVRSFEAMRAHPEGVVGAFLDDPGGDGRGRARGRAGSGRDRERVAVAGGRRGGDRGSGGREAA